MLTCWYQYFDLVKLFILSPESFGRDSWHIKSWRLRCCISLNVGPLYHMKFKTCFRCRWNMRKLGRRWRCVVSSMYGILPQSTPSIWLLFLINVIICGWYGVFVYCPWVGGFGRVGQPHGTYPDCILEILIWREPMMVWNVANSSSNVRPAVFRNVDLKQATILVA